MKYRKKPVEIEAELISFLLRQERDCWDDLPDWVKENHESGKLTFGKGFVSIKTLEGEMRGRDIDYLIKGVRGEIYPCAPGIFEETYEKIES